MDRPEDVEPNPVNGKVYAALTNNSNRGTTYPADEANPLAQQHGARRRSGAPLTAQSGNRNGYVLEMTPRRRRPRRRPAFTWDLMLVCGDPEAPETYFAGFPKDKVSPISCPDNVAFDSDGNLWISTDGNVLGSNDGLFRVPVDGPGARAGRAVPHRAGGRRDLRPADQPTRTASVCSSRSSTPARRRRDVRDPASTWPHTRRLPAPRRVRTVTYRASCT